jgi:hypothetical protein
LTGNGNGKYTYGECLNILHDSINSTPIAERNKKILVTDDATTISETDLNDFLGIISDNGINHATSKPYVENTIEATNKLSNGTNVLINNDNVYYIDNFKQHVENSYYNESDEGPSFLDRLERKLVIQDKYKTQTPYIIGLESFINKYQFWISKIEIDENKTNVDYIYFNSSLNPDSKGVKGLHPTFRIDDEHKVSYNVSDIVTD